MGETQKVLQHLAEQVAAAHVRETARGLSPSAATLGPEAAPPGLSSAYAANFDLSALKLRVNDVETKLAAAAHDTAST